MTFTKIPTVLLVLLALALFFRWDIIGSTTNDGVITKTSKDRWNGAVWQTTIRNGSYSEGIIQPSWIEAMREPIERQVEYQERVLVKDVSANEVKEETGKKQNRTIAEILSSTPIKTPTYETVIRTKTVYMAAKPIYWLSTNGLTRIWIYITLTIGIWLLTAIILKNRKERKLVEKGKSENNQLEVEQKSEI